ncbi:MAG: ATP-binding protein [Firmicutes bacterium]|nr:ATP-binding protein [Bacillota bacterium]
MLLMFKVKNCMSFKDEVILDLRATSYKQHPSHVVYVDKDVALLKTTALYGANASGKSNLIFAMYFFEQYIFSQFINKKENVDLEHLGGNKLKLEPFLLSDSQDDVSEFDIIFYHNGKKIQYGFEFSPEEVKNEWYYINDKMVYEREGTNVNFGKDYQNQLSAYKKIPSERLYIAVLEYFLDDDAKEEILWDFIEFFADEYNIFSEIWLESTVKRVAGMYGISKRLLDDDQYRSKVQRYLQMIDVGIKGLDVQTELVINQKTGEEKKKKVLHTVHNVFDDKGNITGEKYFSLEQESTGTLRFLLYIQRIVDMLERGGVFIVDEFSARLHPLLTKLIVDIFQSSENKDSQLIFTTHDISLLNFKQFRRDEIVFVDKNERGESTLYSLSDLKVREDATFNKDYLQGKYGAIPVLDYDALLGGDENAEN